MVLSIGMIVKNEEKYLEQCLTALQPILKELESELIIADTGSTDRTVEIAKKFTDNVFHFEWIDDFAAARNSTLEKARGEWFMFVDADEIARDCTDLIKFFKTGLYKQFHSASFIQRNYSDEDNWEIYTELRVIRAVKRLPETKFHNPIHEHLYPVPPELGHLNFVLDHYGYLFSGEGGKESARIKGERNLKILFEELDKGLSADRFIVYKQIADCYGSMNDPETALKYLKIGLDKIGHNKMLAAAFYSHMIKCYIHLQNCDEMIAVSDEYFDAEVNPFRTQELASDCFIRWARGYAFLKRDEYQKTIDECIRFFDLYKKYQNDEINTEDLYLNSWEVNEDIVRSCYDIFFRCCYQEKQLELANEYARSFSVSLFDQPEILKNHLNIRVEIMEALGYDSLDELYGQCSDVGKEHLMFVVRLRMLVTDPKNRSVIVSKLSALGGMPAELAEIYKGYYNDAADFGLIKRFLERYGSAGSADLLYILLEKQMDISPFVLAKDFKANIVASTLATSFPKSIELFEDYDIADFSSESLEKAANLYGQIVLEAVKMSHAVSALFEKYGSLGMKWVIAFGDSVPGDIFLALIVNNVVAAKKSGDPAQFSKALDELKKRVPVLERSADAYAQENKDAFTA